MADTTQVDQSGHPYTVEKQTYAQEFNPDGTSGGTYTVHIKHRNGVRTHFKLPEEHYTPMNAHVAAMKQVAAVEGVQQLPTSAVEQMRQRGVQ